MTDKELIELAAKAAGVCLHPEDQLRRSYGNWGCDTTCMACKNDPSDARWHPLTDDGDAHRLAVKLQIWLDYRGVADAHPAHIAAHYYENRKRSSARWVHEHYVPEEMFTSSYAPDRSHAVYQVEQGLTRGLEVATRRAITRAAAEIGKARAAASGAAQGDDHG